MSDVKFKELKWTVEAFTVGKRAKVIKSRRVEAGAYFAVKGRLPQSLPVVYVLVMQKVTNIVRVPFIGLVGQLAASVRLPQQGAFVRAPQDGIVRVLTVERLVTYEELAKLAGGEVPLDDGGEEPLPPPTEGGTSGR